MFPVGYNPNDTDFNQIGKTGGEKTHKLTINEIPAHRHTEVSGISNGDINPSTNYTNYMNPYSDAGKASTALTGGGQAHNNLPPYQVVAYWKRIQ